LTMQAFNSPVGEMAFSTVPGAMTNAETTGELLTQPITNLQSYQEGSTSPNQAVGYAGRDPETGEMHVQLHDGRVVPEASMNDQLKGPAAPPDRVEQQDMAKAQQPTAQQPAPTPGEAGPGAAETQASVLDKLPFMADIKKAVAGAPEWAQEQYDAVSNKAQELFGGNDEIKAMAESVANGGPLPPGAEAQVGQKVIDEVQDPQQAQGLLDGMTGWEKLGLFGGLGLGAVGLITAMSGEGGFGGWLMTILGLGAAGYAAGNAGMLGEGVQGMTQGINDQVGGMVGGLFGPGESGEQQPPESPGMLSNLKSQATDGMASMAPQVLRHLPDAVAGPMLEQYAASNPEIAKKLDMATGHSGLGGNIMGWAGGLMGMDEKQMAEAGFTTPEQQEDLLRRWALMREGQKQQAATAGA